MDKAHYARLYPLYISGDIRWKEQAEQLGYGSGEALRSQFKRERRKRGDASRQDVTANGIQQVGFTGEQTSYQESDGELRVVCDSPRIKSKDDVISHFNIDTNIWEVKKFTIRTSEGYRKDRKVEWDSSGGFGTGTVSDSGKIVVVPMVHTETEFVRKKPDDIWTEKYIRDLFSRIKDKQYLPVTIKPSGWEKNGKCLVVPIADFHLGLLATSKTNNNEYNLEIAERLYLETLSRIKERVTGMKFEEIVFVIGNDFLNSDNLNNTTSHGTPQDNVTFWYEIIDKAIELIIIGINSLLEISKIRVYNVVSNHDGHSMYGVMKVIEAKFENNKNVIVDTSSQPRKYHVFGKSVIGLTHNMKIVDALKLITVEAKEHWSNCNHFIWIMAHLHKMMKYESQGLLEIYRIPTISGFSRWSNENGFVNVEKKTQCFILDEEDGVVDSQYIVVR